MANELSHRVTRSLQVGSLTVGGTVQTIVSNEGIMLQETVTANSVNHAFDLVVTVADVQAIAIEADQDCTVKTNSTSAPDDTLALKAKVPLIWTLSDPSGVNFLTADVTIIYVTTGGSDTLLKFAAAISI